MSTDTKVPHVTSLDQLPYELLVTIVDLALDQKRQPTHTTTTAPVEAEPDLSPTSSGDGGSNSGRVAASLRSVCRTWRVACDQLINHLCVKTWPCPFNLAQRFPATQHVHLHQLSLAQPAKTQPAAQLPATATPAKRHTRSCGPPPAAPAASGSSAAVAAAQGLLCTLAQLPRLCSVTVEQAGAGAARGRAAQGLVAAVVAGLPALPGLKDLVLLGEGIVHAAPAVVAAMAPSLSPQKSNNNSSSSGSSSSGGSGSSSSLTRLVVHNTRLRHLPVPPHALPALQVLHAPGLTSISASLCNDDTSCARLQQLRTLNLQHCKLTSLPSGLGSQLPQLTHMDVSGNSLPSLPPSLGSLVSLQHLDASDNKLATLPPSFTALTALQHLSLSTNWQLGGDSMYCLPHHMPRLQHCDLSATGMAALPVRPEWPALNTLLLSCNELTEVPAALRGFSSLSSLSLDHNELSSLPDWLPTSCPSLTALDASSNRLTRLPATLAALAPSLRSLHLATNSLAHLTGCFSRLGCLTELDLQDNCLGPNLPAQLWECSNIEVLSVAGNKITQLPQQITNLKQLRWLDASHNLLSSLPFPQCTSPALPTPGAGPSSVCVLPHLEVLKLEGNRLGDSARLWAHVAHMHAPRLTVCDLEDEAQEEEEEGAGGSVGAHHQQGQGHPPALPLGAR